MKIDLAHPAAYLLQALTVSICFPVHQATVKKWQDQWTKPEHMVSNGAYQLKEWVVNGHILLKKNPHYWNTAKTVISEVKYLPISNANTVAQMFSAGQVDFTSTTPDFNLKTLQAKYGADNVKIVPMVGTYFYNFNMKKPPFGIGPEEKPTTAEKEKRHKLRQALTMAIDREIITNVILGMGEIPAYRYIPKGTEDGGNYAYPWAAWPQQKRHAAAKKLFQEAGYSSTNPLKFVLAYNTMESHKKIALAISSMWQQLFGNDAIQPKLLNEEWKVFLRDRESGKYPMTRDGAIGDYNEVTTFTPSWFCHSNQNDAQYCNPEYDKLVNEANRALKKKTRIALNEQAQKVFLNDYPIIPLYQYVGRHLIKPHLGGFEGNLIDSYPTQDWYIIAH